MTALMHSEIRKLASTRSWLLLAAAPILYPLLTILLLVLTGADLPSDVSADMMVRGGADIASFALLILGVLAVAGEHRHGTIVPSLLVTPRRVRFAAAKLVSQATVGATVGIAATATALSVGGLYLATQDVSVALLSADVALTGLGVVAVTAFYSTAGAALGAIVRNQTAAIAGALLWLLAVEQVVPMVLRRPGLRRWLPGGATSRLLQLADPPLHASSAWVAALILVVVAAVLITVALVTMARTDVD